MFRHADGRTRVVVPTDLAAQRMQFAIARLDLAWTVRLTSAPILVLAGDDRHHASGSLGHGQIIVVAIGQFDHQGVF